jgi:hypothetical protein
MVKFVQTGNMLLIGGINSEKPNILTNPRIVVIKNVNPNTMQVGFLPLISEPSQIEIHNKEYSYDVSNDELLDKYMKETSGIVLPLARRSN